MRSSNGRIVKMLEVCSTKDHFYRMTYKNPDKAALAAKGFLTAMRESPPDAVCAIWENGIFTSENGIAEIKIPAFSIRAGEIGSVCLRDFDTHAYEEWKNDQDEGEAWKRSG